MIRYVLGFMISQNRDEVLLLVKDHPEWQKGKLNGIGGKIAPGENAILAMVREFKEEVGIDTQVSEWNKVCVIKGSDWECVVYTTFSAALHNHQKLESEEPVVLPIKNVLFNDQAIGNLKWLIPMCIDADAFGEAVIDYN